MPVLSSQAKPAALQEALVSQGKAVVRRAQSHRGSYACQQPLLSQWHHAYEHKAAVEGTQAGVTNRLADVHSLCVYPGAGDRVAGPLTAELRTRPGSIPEGLASPSRSSTTTRGPSRLAAPGGVLAEAPGWGQVPAPPTGRYLLLQGASLLFVWRLVRVTEVGSLSILLTCDHRKAVGPGYGRGGAAPDPDLTALCRGPPELLLVSFPSRLAAKLSLASCRDLSCSTSSPGDG